MSLLTNQQIGLYPEDRERIARIQAARPDLSNTSALFRLALRELDERVARRQKPDAGPEPKDAPTPVDRGDRGCGQCHPERYRDGEAYALCEAHSTGFASAPPAPPASTSTPSNGARLRAAMGGHASACSRAEQGRRRLRAAMVNMSGNAFDKLAKVGRGTAAKVLAGKTSLESAGGGKLLKLVEKIERGAAAAPSTP